MVEKYSNTLESQIEGVLGGLVDEVRLARNQSRRVLSQPVDLAEAFVFSIESETPVALEEVIEAGFDLTLGEMAWMGKFIPSEPLLPDPKDAMDELAVGVVKAFIERYPIRERNSKQIWAESQMRVYSKAARHDDPDEFLEIAGRVRGVLRQLVDQGASISELYIKYSENLKKDNF